MSWNTDYTWDYEDSQVLYRPGVANVDLVPNTSGDLGHIDEYENVTRWNKAWLTELSVSGNAYIGGDVEIINELSCGSIVAGAVACAGLTSSGDISATGIEVGDISAVTLNLSGSAAIEGEIGAGSLQISGNAAIAGNVSLGGDIAVGGSGKEIKLFYGDYYVGLKAPASLTANKDLTLPSSYGDAGQVLATNGSGTLSWTTPSGGDVTGPGSSTDNAIVRFNGTTGKLIQASGVTINDANDLGGVRNLGMSGDIAVTGNATVAGFVQGNLKGSPTVTLGEAGTRWLNAYLKCLDVSANANVSIVGDNAAPRTITIGQHATYTDLINVGGEFGTSLIPNSAGKELGSSTKRWGKLYGSALDIDVGAGNEKAKFVSPVEIEMPAAASQVTVKAHASQSANVLELRNSGGTARFAVDENFYLGVGMNDPSLPLHVRKGTSGNWPVQVPSDVAAFYQTANASDSATIEIVSGAEGRAGIFFGNVNTIGRGSILYDNADDSLNFYATSKVAINPSQSNVDFVVSVSAEPDLLVADNSGVGVGVGTGAPGARLHVKGGISDQKTMRIQAAASQSVNVFEIGDSGGNAKFTVDSSYDVSCEGNVNTNGVFKVDGTQVISNRQSAIADLSPTTGTDEDGEARVAINSILAAMRTHGLIASS